MVKIEYIKSFAREYINGNHRIEWETEIRRVYRLLYNQPLSGCRTCIKEGLLKILENYRNMGNFQIKRGVQLYETGKVLNWKTQNDALCKYWLLKDPNNVRYFDKIPADFLETLTEQQIRMEEKMEIIEPIYNPEPEIETVPEIKEIEKIEKPVKIQPKKPAKKTKK